MKAVVVVYVRRAARPSAAGLLAAGVLLLAAAGASAASPPSAVTGPVTALGGGAATVTGTVNPNGVATSWYVEYGTSTGYGSKTTSRSAGSGTAGVSVSASLTGLASATTYHYRVVATSSAGTSRGADGIFTTPAPPGVVTGPAADVTVTGARLTGTVDPNARATTWWFEYGTSTSYGSKTPQKSGGSGTTAAAVSATLTGLSRGTRYHFRLVATSDAGTTHGADATFSTVGAPSVVTGSATGATPTTARLNGTVTPNGRSTTWWFEYGTSTSYGSKTPQKSAGAGTTAVGVASALSGLRAATTYHFRLVASNGSGTTAGSDRTFSTSFPPGVQTGGAVNVAYSSATATGAVDPRGRRTTWWFEYGATTAYGSKTPNASAGSGTKPRGVTASISGLAPSTTYHVRLVATSDAGTSRGADVAFTTTGVTLTAPALSVVYGREVMLGGTVPTRRAGETVTLFAQGLGEGSPHSIARVLTAEGGVWRYLAEPRIQTAYRASWNGGLSAATVVGVRPSVSFRRLADGRFSTRVLAARSFAGRLVQLQRRTPAGTWLTVRRARLGARSAAAFRAQLPPGRSTLRIAMSVNQAGAGYLAGISRTIVVRRG